jgi:hypothetical protein
MAFYRSRGITKRVGSKTRRYRNLATFNKECPTRGTSGNFCSVTNTRRLKDGSGLATVVSRPWTSTGGKKRGTWTLHFASYDIMKRHLKKRA